MQNPNPIGKSCFVDLSERVADRAEGVNTRAGVAERLSVSRSRIRRLLQRRREIGSIVPIARVGGRPPVFDTDAAERLCRAVEVAPGATLVEPARADGSPAALQ